MAVGNQVREEVGQWLNLQKSQKLLLHGKIIPLFHTDV